MRVHPAEQEAKEWAFRLDRVLPSRRRVSMGLRIHTNVPSLVAQRNLDMTRGAVDRSLERLSSGLRINHAGDDASGLAISETLRAQTRDLSQVARNAQDGISVLQIAEGSLQEVTQILIRLRELGVQAASDTVGNVERGFLDIEYQHLLQEIDRIANTTEFNGTTLLNGSVRSFQIQIGTHHDPDLDRIQIFNPRSVDVNTTSLGLNLSSVSTKRGAQTCLQSIDFAIQSINELRSQLGSVQARLQSTLNHIAVSKENLTEATSRIRDMDIAEETTQMTKNQILMQTGVAVLAQANTLSKNILSLLEPS
jgi:flagellin